MSTETIPTQADAKSAFLAKFNAPAAPVIEEPTDLTGMKPVMPGDEPEPKGDAPAGDAPESADVPAGEAPATDAGEAPKAEGKFRNPDGTFAKTIKGEFQGQPFEFPETALVPVKRNGEVKMLPFRQALDEGMLREDYHAKRQEESAVVRQSKADAAAARAESQVYEWIIKELIADPNKVLQLADNPEVAKLFADSNELKIDKARRTAADSVSSEQAVQSAQADVVGWLQGMAVEFPGTDAAVVQQQYANYLVSEAAQRDPAALSPERIRQFYEREHARVQGSQKPLLDEMAALRAEIASLKAGKASEVEVLKKNAATEHALKRAKAPPVAGGVAGGAVAGGNSGPVTGEGGKPLPLNTASKEFLKRYQ